MRLIDADILMEQILKASVTPETKKRIQLRTEPVYERPAKDPKRYKYMKTANGSYRTSPKYGETKSRRLQILVKPSLFEMIKECANANKISINEFVSLVLLNYFDD